MKNGFRDGKSPIPENAFPSKKRSRGLVPGDTAGLSAPLRQCRAELSQALTASKRQSAAAQKKMETLAQTNSYLRRELIRAEKEMETANRLAYHDALTGLPNRRLLLDRLSLAVAQAARQKKCVALVFFDVDGFKALNDKFGHTSGDQLLQGVAERLSACLRATDTACRYGGDEFIVLLPEVENAQSAAVVEQKIRTRLAVPHFVDGTMITVTLSIGTAVYPVDAEDHRDLIKLADAAMYSMKPNGGAFADRQAHAQR